MCEDRTSPLDSSVGWMYGLSDSLDEVSLMSVVRGSGCSIVKGTDQPVNREVRAADRWTECENKSGEYSKVQRRYRM